VQFLGTVADIVAVLHATDVIALTSRTEGLPGSLIEAGLCGVPAVATDVGGVRDIVVDRVTGRVVPVGDVDEIVRALSFVFERRAELGSAARDHCVRHFGVDVALDAWEALLRTAGRRTA
jgi:glycosyltransferase involved in cell wall biosynthesis